MATETFGSRYDPSDLFPELFSDNFPYNDITGDTDYSASELLSSNANDNLPPMISLDYRDGSPNLLEDSDDDEDNPDSQGWMNKPIGVWTKLDTKGWLYTASNKIGQLYRDISPKLVVSGTDLQLLTRQDFLNCDRRHGGELYDLLSKLDNRVLEPSKPPELVNVPELKVTLEDDEPLHGSDSASGDEIVKRVRQVRPLGKKTKNARPKIWEFIKNLLLDPKTCPELIKWENYEEKTFVFVDSKKVAQLWGAYRDKDNNMNFEKFSRLMRHYYKKDFLRSVPGRRLVYQFGPNVTGLETSNPNFENKSAVENQKIHSPS